MKLLYVAPLDSIHARRWISFFSCKGHEIEVIDSRNTNREELFGSKVHQIFWDEFSHMPRIVRLLRHIAKLPFFINAFKSILNTFRPDVVHLLMMNGPFAYAIAYTNNRPFIATPYGSDVLIHTKESRLHHFVIKKVISSADRFCCDAQHLSEALQSYGAPADAIDLVHFGTDTKLFSPEAKDDNLAEELGFLPGTPLIISNRLLREVYDVGTFIKAIPHVISQFPTSGFVIVGEGEQKSSLEQLAQKLNISPYVRFVGRLSDEDMVRYTASASIYVSTSLSDGGLAASTAEAMACSVPIVITDFGENAEWTDQEKAGYLFEMKNSSQLASKLAVLLTDEQSRNEMGSHGRKLILERNDFYKEMSRVEQIYEQLHKAA